MREAIRLKCLQDKPLCATWNGGAAVQGLADATSTNFDIVNDPVLVQPRNFPLQWTATNEGWEFIPNGSTYTQIKLHMCQLLQVQMFGMMLMVIF